MATQLPYIQTLLDDPAFERILIGETGLPHPRLITLETRPPNAEGQGAVTMLDLVQGALRMRPDRILVEELLGTETSELVRAMNRGHDGSLFTLNSNGPRDTLSRLERLDALGDPEVPLLAVREQISSAIDLIVHLERIRDGSRRIVHISEVRGGIENGVIVLSDIFMFESLGYADGVFKGSLWPTGIIPAFMDALNNAGIHMPVSIFTPENQ